MNLLASGGIAHSVGSRAAVEIDSDSDQTLTVSHDFGVNVLVSSKVNNEGAVSAIGNASQWRMRTPVVQGQ